MWLDLKSEIYDLNTTSFLIVYSMKEHNKYHKSSNSHTASKRRNARASIYFTGKSITMQEVGKRTLKTR